MYISLIESDKNEFNKSIQFIYYNIPKINHKINDKLAIEMNSMSSIENLLKSCSYLQEISIESIRNELYVDQQIFNAGFKNIIDGLMKSKNYIKTFKMNSNMLI